MRRKQKGHAAPPKRTARDRSTYGSDRAAEERDYMREYFRRRRAVLVEEHGGRCESCGSTERLHFHHNDPAEKAFTISSNIGRRPIVMATELSKCRLLCERCHCDHHASLHGTVSRYVHRRCRCELCVAAGRAANRTAMRRWRARQRELNPPPARRGRTHGNSGYVGGCRCEICRDGMRRYHREWRARQRDGGGEHG